MFEHSGCESVVTLRLIEVHCVEVGWGLLWYECLSHVLLEVQLLHNIAAAVLEVVLYWSEVHRFSHQSALPVVFRH